MTSEQYLRVGELYHAAIELAPEAQVEFLAGACGSDDELRREVESLLQARRQADGFIAGKMAGVVAVMAAQQQNPSLVGRSFGYYQALWLIGAGGMGEVYLAEDTRLGRKVALKLLPAAFTQDQERVRRFKQEARAASSLNHPNILTIHEIGEVPMAEGGAHYIVSEFVEGETLRAMLRGGRLDISKAAAIAEQVASALSVAHEAGIVHRDIKPENVMVRPDGLVKVLDFGLAKLTERPTAAPEADSQAETMARLSTEPGVVMGTVSYMSPEQARGLKVDHRTDIFSLGVMLYEMVAGRRPFEGETASDVIAAILQNNPAPVSQSKPGSLPEIDQVINRMIGKDREARYQSAAELRANLQRLHRKLEVDETFGSGEAHGEIAAGQGAGEAKWLALALGLVLLAFGASVFWYVKLRGGASETQADERPVVVKTAQLTSWTGVDFYPAFERDSNTIAFCSDRSGNFEIYIKQLVEGAREVQLTSDGGQNFQPDFSPDGSLIAYHSKKRGGIWVVPVTGGAAKQLTEFGSHPAWSPDGSQIAFQSEPLRDVGSGVINAMPPSTIWTVPTKGGEPRQLTQAGVPPGGHGKPSWSPDRKRIAFDAGDLAGLVVWSVSAQGDDLKKISSRIRDATDAVYAPDGRSIFVVADTGWSLYKIGLSEAGDPIGEPVIVFSGSGPRIRYFSIAANGKNIVYSALSTMSNIWAIPLAPNTIEARGKPVQFTQNANTRAVHPAFSPDGKTIAYHTFGTGITYQIWTMDADGKNQTQITTGSGLFPWWFPDGRRIAFESRRENRAGFWSVTVEGGRERKLFDFEEDASIPRLSPDGKRVAFNSKRSGTLNIWLVPIEGGQPKQLTFDKELMGFPAWSPDGKLIAFETKRGADTHVAIIPSDGGEPIQLTSDQGQSFVYDWSPDGERVLFAGQRNGVWNVWSVSRSTRQQKQMTNYTTFNSYVRWPAWSPLGDKIVYEYAETTGNIWLMELK